MYKLHNTLMLSILLCQTFTVINHLTFSLIFWYSDSLLTMKMAKQCRKLKYCQQTVYFCVCSGNWKSFIELYLVFIATKAFNTIVLQSCWLYVEWLELWQQFDRNEWQCGIIDADLLVQQWMNWWMREGRFFLGKCGNKS